MNLELFKTCVNENLTPWEALPVDARNVMDVMLCMPKTRKLIERYVFEAMGGTWEPISDEEDFVDGDIYRLNPDTDRMNIWTA